MTSAFDDSLHVFRYPGLTSIIAAAAEFFARTPDHPLPPTDKFIGPGVYALYYRGAFLHYAPLSKLNLDRCIYPIYAGKAVPKGTRRGRVIDIERADLHGRLQEHAESIAAVEAYAVQHGIPDYIKLSEFRCRFITMRKPETDFIVPLESYLFSQYHPLWIDTVPGFGLHDVGGKRYGQIKSMWDTLHPGRAWALKMYGPVPPVSDIITRIETTLSALTPP